MIAILKNGTTPEQKNHLIQWLKKQNLDVHVSEGKQVTILGLVGDTSRVDMELLCSLEIVESVMLIPVPAVNVPCLEDKPVLSSSLVGFTAITFAAATPIYLLMEVSPFTTLPFATAKKSLFVRDIVNNLIYM